MAVDLHNIEQTFVKIAREGVGHLLSCLKPNIPSVILSLNGGPIPDYPFVELSVDGISKTDGYLFNEFIDENGNTVYDTFYKVELRYTVFGSNKSQKRKAVSIAQELESYFRLNHVLAKIEQETTGSLENTSDVIPSPQRLATEYGESAYFTLTMNVNDRYVSTEDGYFDTIEIGGKVMRDQNDPDPFLFDLIETSNTT